MFEGFKKYVMRGNVIDLAAAVIIGAAFGAIIDSLVKDIVTPMIGMLGGQPDFSALKIGSIGIGNFVNSIVSFLIKAAGLYFLVILPFNRIATRLAEQPAPPPPPTPTETYLREIRDLLAAKQP
jgi:large conductance mechanosensitive channel